MYQYLNFLSKRKKKRKSVRKAFLDIIERGINRPMNFKNTCKISWLFQSTSYLCVFHELIDSFTSHFSKIHPAKNYWMTLIASRFFNCVTLNHSVFSSRSAEATACKTNKPVLTSSRKPHALFFVIRGIPF